MPDRTPRRNPTVRLSRRLRNKLPWPHSCIRPKTRTVNRMMGSNGTTASQGDTPAHLIAAHQRSVKGTKVAKTCFNPLMSSDLVYRPIMARFWRLKQSFDTIETPLGSPRFVQDRLDSDALVSTRGKPPQYVPSRPFGARVMRSTSTVL